MKKSVLFVLVCLLLTLTAHAQDFPEPIPQQAIYIPYPVEIALDGDITDWRDIPPATVTTGTQVSTNPAENGFFTFAVAGDDENLYVLMFMPDATIVTGQHGTDFWNEDSMEFYLNFTDDPFREDYTDGVFQINLNAGDIGNTDPSAVTVTGNNSASANVQAIVFETTDGWGIEAAVPYPDGFTPEHGRNIGLQAHINGSSGADRDIKLIWAAADEADTSWQTPAVWGLGVFYQVGSDTVPEPSVRPEPVEVVETRPVAVNQVGYLPDAPKYAMLPNGRASGATFLVINADTNETVHAGFTPPAQHDPSSGDMVWIADFSAVTEPGNYRVVINDVVSDTFRIGTDIYDQLRIDALRYFYLNRSGIELDAEHAGEWARPAGHLTDNDVTCYAGTDAAGTTWDGCDYRLNAAGGWYDAGDYGKYVVNGGISAWTLLNLYERLPDAIPDGALNIPESGNGVSDLLDEARWEVEWLLSMQVPEDQPLGGMVHHKLHDLRWAGLPLLPPTEWNNDDPSNGRMLMPPSTAATYNMAAVAAMCARIWRDIDAAFADRCLTAARAAFNAAGNNPVMLAGNTPGQGGGNYDDQNTADERFWAAAELFITTGERTYFDVMTNDSTTLPAFAGMGEDAAMWWGGVGSLGSLSLIQHTMQPDSLDLFGADVTPLRDQVIAAADEYLARMTDGYHVSIRQYVWGSNSSVLNNAIALAYAYEITGDAKYRNGVIESLDYVLGRNANAFSYVSGYGTRTMQHPHHRFWANQGNYPPPPPGAIAGGANEFPAEATAQNRAAELGAEAGASRRYIDHIDSYSTNEVAINWNAPLAWVAAWVDALD